MIENLVLAVDGAWKVLIIGLVIGAGLPVLFALGVRSYAYSVEDGTAGQSPTGNRQVHRLASVICFALVVLGVLAGIGAIVASGFDVEISSWFG